MITEALLEQAVALAREAGHLTQRWFQSSELTVERKGDGTPVTQADRAAEALLRTRLRDAFPHDSIVGEEEAPFEGTSGRTWYVDPIDGTKAFSRGVPLYSNLLALVDTDGSAIGVINIPATGETVFAGRELGCYYNEQRCSVSTTSALADSYVMTSGLSHWPRPALNTLIDVTGGVRTWGDGYGYTLVATGRADAMVDPIVSPYDIAPMPVILAEAGGRFTDLSGRPGFEHGSGLASNGTLHRELIGILSS